MGGVTVAAGTRRAIELPVASLPTDTSLSMPVAVVNGLRPGPKVWLNAVIHGDELNGVEIIRQVLQLLKPRDLHGTVLGGADRERLRILNEAGNCPTPHLNALPRIAGARSRPEDHRS